MNKYTVVSKYLINVRTGGPVCAQDLYVLEKDLYIFHRAEYNSIEIEDGKKIEAAVTAQAADYGYWVPWATQAIEDVISGNLFPIWTAGQSVSKAVVKCANNDGRDTCYSCGAPTKTVLGFSSTYQVCTVCGI